MKSLLTFILVLTGTAAFSETLPELRSRISGSEIVVEGHIGTGLDMMDDEALVFRDADGGTYQVVFDAGRDARKSLDGCKFAMFGGGSPCALAAKAEVELDGSRLRLIVFEVTTIGAPAPLN